jgi:antitoxin ParD1/3/4
MASLSAEDKIMNTMNIALPAEMKDFVRDAVTQGGYSSASEYIRDLIRQEQKRQTETKLETLLIKGLDSGPMREITDKDWEALRKKLSRRHRSTNGKRRI